LKPFPVSQHLAARQDRSGTSQVLSMQKLCKEVSTKISTLSLTRQIYKIVVNQLICGKR